MTVDLSKLAADAQAISTASPKIRTFALDLVEYLREQATPIPTPTPTPTPAPTDPAKYVLDYSTGDWTQWGGQGQLQVTNGGLAQPDAAPITAGAKYAGRFTTPNQVGNTGDHTSRCQVYLDGHSDYGHEGIEEWYAFAFKATSGSVFAGGTQGGWNNLVSFHHSNIANTLIAPAHFAVANSNALPSGNSADLSLYLTAYGGKWANSGSIQYEKSWTLLRPLPLAEVVRVVYHVRWSADDTKGFQEAWVNGNHVLPLTVGANLYTVNSDGTGGSDPIYLKQGIDTAGGYAKPTTVLYAETRIAATEAGVV